MRKPALSIPQLAVMFHTSEDNIKKQYAANIEGLKKDYAKAIRIGKKVRGYTADEIKENYEQLEFILNSSN